MNLAILLAAGKSKRFGKEKTLEILLGEPVFAHSLVLLEASPFIHEIFIVANSGNEKKIRDFLQRNRFSKIKKILRGGKTRFESVKRAISKITKADIFVIHNAANPLSIQEELKRCFVALKKGICGVAVGRKITSTVKKIGRTLTTIPRENLWEVETPQVVRAKEFAKACRKFPSEDFTDDLAVLEKAGFKTALVEASPHNRKITTSFDLEIMKQGGDNLVGIGEDSHRFVEHGTRNEKLILGGVEFPKFPALEAQSDGDVMIHALCNAISSALGGGSLGTYATKMQKNGIRDSREYLKFTMRQVDRKHRKISQCSFSIEAKQPAIDPLASRIKKNLSKLLEIAEVRIGITATSGENLTPFGRGEAIKCTAAVLLCSK